MTTGAVRVSDSHCQYSNWRAGVIAIAMTGTDSSTAVTSRCFSGRSSSASVGAVVPAACPPFPVSGGGGGAAV